uniref:Transposase n=1 Tax=Acrobeloides nanus TaxID=290746 RepID=A0A914EMM5_9BILA
MPSFGDSMGKIAKDLRISKATVQTAIERGTIEDRPGRGRKKTARSQQNIRRAKAMIQRNPTTKANSYRKLAKKLEISHVQAWQILREDLGLKPWKYQKRQKLTENAKQKRLDRCRAMLRRFSRRRHRNIVFSDEKLFDIQQAFNPQNNRIWAEEEPDSEERAVERTQKAESVMVWAAITALGKTPLVFVPQNVKINKEVYTDVLERHLLPWAHTIFGDDEWTFQQDGAPGHKAYLVQDWL